MKAIAEPTVINPAIVALAALAAVLVYVAASGYAPALPKSLRRPVEAVINGV